jgi:acetolactate synthase-1/2/3 large subunit
MATLADWLGTFLLEQGVRRVYHVPGGMIALLMDSLARTPGLEVITTRHEQGAAFAAEGEARMTGIPGVALATSGPGATNLLTGIGSCYFDSIPAVFITGQVKRSEQRGARTVRQVGFQETDIVAMAAPVTKAAIAIHEIEEAVAAFEDAFRIALSGRPGPVLVDVPLDLQRAEVTRRPRFVARSAPATAPVDQVERAARRLLAAERPLILAGGGVWHADAQGELLRVAALADTPVVHSLMAADVVPHGHRHRGGMIGTYGNRWANLALGRSDHLLVVGSRLDIRQTGADVAWFCRDRTADRVDCDAAEIAEPTGPEAIRGDVREFLTALGEQLLRLEPPQARDGWVEEIAGLRASWPDADEVGDVENVNPNAFVAELTASCAGVAAIVTDVGQHQMWLAQSVRPSGGQRVITPGGMAAIGFGLPAAIGVALSDRAARVLLIAGDGGLQTNLQELETLVQLNLNVGIVVLDNGCHGMVRQFQTSYLDSRHVGTRDGYSAPDFVRVAAAFGIPALGIAEQHEVGAGIDFLLEGAGPRLLSVAVDPDCDVYPKVAFGRPLTEMEPFVRPVALEGT